MLEDELLVWGFKRGSDNALRWIYEKYRDNLLKLAMSLLNQSDIAEDIVHDVFTSFIDSACQFELTGSLRGYLATCVANRARNANRNDHRRKTFHLDQVSAHAYDLSKPEPWIMCSDEMKRLGDALAQLPYNQREAITLHLHGGMKFREIAKFQDVPVKTAQSRYRNGLEKLRSLLNGEVAR